MPLVKQRRGLRKEEKRPKLKLEVMCRESMRRQSSLEKKINSSHYVIIWAHRVVGRSVFLCESIPTSYIAIDDREEENVSEGFFFHVLLCQLFQETDFSRMIRTLLI